MILIYIVVKKKVEKTSRCGGPSRKISYHAARQNEVGWDDFRFRDDSHKKKYIFYL